MVYPLNEMIEKILASAVDEETGEMLLTEEEIEQMIAEAGVEFDDKIKALRNSYLTDKMNAEIIKAEASALWKLQQEASRRAEALKNSSERKKRFIAYLLKGETFDKDGVKIGYTRRKDIVVEEGFIDWAKTYAPGMLKEPEIRKADLNAAVKAGQHFEFVHEEERKEIKVK